MVHPLDVAPIGNHALLDLVDANHEATSWINGRLDYKDRMNLGSGLTYDNALQEGNGGESYPVLWWSSVSSLSRVPWMHMHIPGHITYNLQASSTSATSN